MFSSKAVRHLARVAVKTGSRSALRAAGSQAARLAPSSMASSAALPMPVFRAMSTKVADDAALSRDGYKVSRIYKGPGACKEAGLDKLGITGPTTVYRNLSYEEIHERELIEGHGEIAKCKYGDVYQVDTGIFTGRSPKDRYLVKVPGSVTAENIHWNDINMPVTPETFEDCFAQGVAHYNEIETAYILDAYCGVSPGSRRKVRFILESAWHLHFVTNMFIRPLDPSELDDFVPDFTLLNSSGIENANWKKQGVRSSTTVIFNPEKNQGIVLGSLYGGEMKKGIFGMMNYWLPMEGKLAMHCSANVGKDGDVCLFFGLSGTGKTTLSADPVRALIGDDEHGWDHEGIFNFEGGCYAKTINLTEENEPDIFKAIKTDALFENVMVKSDGTPDYFDVSKTENGRVSYPIFHIPNHHKEQMAGHPNNIIFLACDAFGVLPPVARLSPGQAMYHFMAGYTAKVAGTERGIVEPVPNFSACFGAAFMTLHPTRYADLLKEKMEKHGTKVFLVNSGWSGGPYGVGDRMSIKTTRKCVNAIICGDINDAKFHQDPVFGFEVPESLPGIDSHLLDPKSTWADKKEYDKTANKLAQMFVDNFKKYEGVGKVDYTKFGPHPLK